VSYHWSHSSQWVVRLGDGTDESHAKVQQSLEDLWPFTGELFTSDDVDRAAAAAGLFPVLEDLQAPWVDRVKAVLDEAGLNTPENGWMQRGGKQGIHSEHLGYMLAEMQVLPRTYPDATW